MPSASNISPKVHHASVQGQLSLGQLTRNCLNELLAWHQSHHPHISEHWLPLYDLRDRLNQPAWHIVVLGQVSRGKSALLNALYGETIFPVGAIHGTTQWPRTVRWQFGDHAVDLTDTPGLDEVAGSQREAMTWGAIATADLVLLVSHDTLTPIEVQARQQLEARRVPYQWVITKADLYAAVPENLTDAIVVSSTTGQGISELRAHVQQWLSHNALLERSTHLLHQASTIERAVGNALSSYRQAQQGNVPWPWLGGQLLGSALLPGGGGDAVLAVVASFGYVRHWCQAYALPFPLPAFSEISQFLLLWCAAIYVTPWLGGSISGELWSLNTTVVLQAGVILWGYQQLRRKLESYLQQGYQWGRFGPQRLLAHIAQQQQP
jgi:small GTP-binding protein